MWWRQTILRGTITVQIDCDGLDPSGTREGKTIGRSGSLPSSKDNYDRGVHGLVEDNLKSRKGCRKTKQGISFTGPKLMVRARDRRSELGVFLKHLGLLRGNRYVPSCENRL